MEGLKRTRQVVPQAQPALQPSTTEPSSPDLASVPLMWTDYRRQGFRASRRGEQAVEACPALCSAIRSEVAVIFRDSIICLTLGLGIDAIEHAYCSVVNGGKTPTASKANVDVGA